MVSAEWMNYLECVAGAEPAARRPSAWHALQADGCAARGRPRYNQCLAAAQLRARRRCCIDHCRASARKSATRSELNSMRPERQ